MKNKQLLFPILLATLLSGCSYLEPAGDGTKRNGGQSTPTDELVYESIWDFTDLDFKGNLNNSTPNGNLLSHCNSKQTSSIVKTITSDGCKIENINSTKKDRRLSVGYNTYRSYIRFDLDATVRYVEVFAETYHYYEDNRNINIYSNSAIHVYLKEQYINLSTEDNSIAEKSQKFSFLTDDYNYFSLYTNSAEEKVLISKIIVGYVVNEK